MLAFLFDVAKLINFNLGTDLFLFFRIQFREKEPDWTGLGYYIQYILHTQPRDTSCTVFVFKKTEFSLHKVIYLISFITCYMCFIVHSIVQYCCISGSDRIPDFFWAGSGSIHISTELNINKVFSNFHERRSCKFKSLNSMTFPQKNVYVCSYIL